MKIDVRPVESVSICTLQAGQTFEYNGEHGLIINEVRTEGFMDYVYLDTGTVDSLPDHTAVNPIKLKVVIDE